MPSVIRSIAVNIALTTIVAAAAAADLPPPASEPILTVNGAIAVTNSGDTAQFDLEMLRALPATEFTTTTIWTKGEQTFEGVALADLLEALGVEAGNLRATAINDYAVEIPVSDAVDGGPILAYAQNGAEMSVRDKGPLWVVYPYDSKAEYQSEVIYSRSIWQLDRITVED